MYDDRLFFQLAAALIPALLFGGLVSGVFRPRDDLRRIRLWQRLSLLLLITLAVLAALVAEVFAIDLATSPESLSIFKVGVVIYVLLLATASAGFALLWPFVRVLGAPYERRYLWPLGAIGLLGLLVGSFVLVRAIGEAVGRSNDQRFACFQRESLRELREYTVNAFAARDARAARLAELAEIRGERTRLQEEEGLSPSARRTLEEALDVRTELGHIREDAAERLARELRELREFRDPGDTQKGGVETSFRVYGC